MLMGAERDARLQIQPFSKNRQQLLSAQAWHGSLVAVLQSEFPHLNRK
jgi:hypothetical protein